MDNYKIKFAIKGEGITPIHTHVCQNQFEAILAAIGAVNAGLTNVARVYNLNENMLIYETTRKAA